MGYPDRRQTMDYPPNNRGFQGNNNYNQRHESMHMPPMNRRNTNNGPPRDGPPRDGRPNESGSIGPNRGPDNEGGFNQRDL